MRGAVSLSPPVREWGCPNCASRQQTREAAPHVRFHPCPGLKGVLAPMIEVGVRARVIAVVREDYVGAERGITYDDDKRPIMSVVTERPDGSNDCAVFAPVAEASWRAS